VVVEAGKIVIKPKEVLIVDRKTTAQHAEAAHK